MSSVHADEATLSAPSGHLAAVDGVRAVAALAVLVYHVAARVGLNGTAAIGAYTGRLGSFGVAIFFVLSGFLLYRPYAFAHFTGRAAPASGEFLRRRFFRIFPAYWVALTAFIVVVHQAPVRSPKDVAQLYLLLQIYDQNTVLAGLGQAWSLCVELSFYLLLPLIALGVREVGRRMRAAGRTTLQAELWSVSGLVFIGVAYRLWLIHVTPSWTNPTVSWITSTIDWFAIGMLFAVLRAHVESSNRPLPGPVLALASRPLLSWVLGAELYWVLVQLRMPLDFAPLSGVQLMGKHVLLGAAAGLFVLPAVLGMGEASGVRRLLTSSPLRWVGAMSYSVFLWHVVWLREASRWLDKPAATGGFWPLLVVTVAATLCCSVLSYRYIELPAMRYGRRPRRTSERQPPSLSSQLH
ncbi:MAG: hypothetical protein QOG87_993 [Actinomycetota bacterium]